MRIFHLTQALLYGDAVGSDVRALNTILVEMGFHSKIYTMTASVPLRDYVAHDIDDMPETKDDDIIIYHLAIGGPMNELYADLKGKKVIIYHNITPPEFFAIYDKSGFYSCSIGYAQTRKLAKVADYCIAISSYNGQQLRDMGYTCPIDVVPILVPFDDYKQKPSSKALAKYADTCTNILFVGRVAPNKHSEDVIAAFATYKRKYNPRARLFLVGGYDENGKYYKSVQKFIKKLGVSDVIFPGHIKFDEVLAYYHLADLFVCMSDHEGFGVPLVEAMCFDIPIIAKDTSAMASTLGGSGLLLDTNDPAIVASAMNRVLTDDKLREAMLVEERRRLNEFSYENVKSTFEVTFMRILDYLGGC